MCQKESQMEAQRTFKSVPLVLFFFRNKFSLCERNVLNMCALCNKFIFLAPTGFHVRHCLRFCLPCYLRILLPREFLFGWRKSVQMTSDVIGWRMFLGRCFFNEPVTRKRDPCDRQGFLSLARFLR